MKPLLFKLDILFTFMHFYLIKCSITLWYCSKSHFASWSRKWTSKRSRNSGLRQLSCYSEQQWWSRSTQSCAKRARSMGRDRVPSEGTIPWKYKHLQSCLSRRCDVPWPLLLTHAREGGNQSQQPGNGSFENAAAVIVNTVRTYVSDLWCTVSCYVRTVCDDIIYIYKNKSLSVALTRKQGTGTYLQLNGSFRIIGRLLARNQGIYHIKSTFTLSGRVKYTQDHHFFNYYVACPDIYIEHFSKIYIRELSEHVQVSVRIAYSQSYSARLMISHILSC